MVFHSKLLDVRELSGLINFTTRICSVAIVAIYLGTPAARIYTKILESWAERVEMGDWQVDEDGVVGGIDKFKEADTEEHWREYFIPW
jgi:hypothetical protein